MPKICQDLAQNHGWSIGFGQVKNSSVFAFDVSRDHLFGSRCRQDASLCSFNDSLDAEEFTIPNRSDVFPGFHCSFIPESLAHVGPMKCFHRSEGAAQVLQLRALSSYTNQAFEPASWRHVAVAVAAHWFCRAEDVHVCELIETRDESDAEVWLQDGSMFSVHSLFNSTGVVESFYERAIEHHTSLSLLVLYRPIPVEVPHLRQRRTAAACEMRHQRGVPQPPPVLDLLVPTPPNTGLHARIKQDLERLSQDACSGREKMKLLQQLLAQSISIIKEPGTTVWKENAESHDKQVLGEVIEQLVELRINFSHSSVDRTLLLSLAFRQARDCLTFMASGSTGHFRNLLTMNLLCRHTCLIKSLQRDNALAISNAFDTRTASSQACERGVAMISQLKHIVQSQSELPTFHETALVLRMASSFCDIAASLYHQHGVDAGQQVGMCISVAMQIFLLLCGCLPPQLTAFKNILMECACSSHENAWHLRDLCTHLDSSPSCDSLLHRLKKAVLSFPTTLNDSVLLRTLRSLEQAGMSCPELALVPHLLIHSSQTD